MFPLLTIDSTNCSTELCSLGGKFNTDKSPYNSPPGHRHSYTAIYTLLMSQYKNKPVRFVEIGIEKGASIQLWMNYFLKGTFFFFDCGDVSGCEKYMNESSKIGFMDVRSPYTIVKGLETTGGNLDILLDDSSHKIEDQINIINYSIPFIRSGGMIIIEDIFKETSEEKYYNLLKEVIHNFSFITFINSNNINNNSDGWNNDKLLVLIKK